MTPLVKRSAIAVTAIVFGLGAWLAVQRPGALATPPTQAAPTAPSGSTGPASVAAEQEAEAPAAADSASVVSADVRIVFSTVPPADATVTWGSARLGRITRQRPLVIVRPRDSGPLDVMVRAAGYLPVQTRAHTFEDTRVQVKLTPPAQKHTLLGYRAPIDAGVPLDPEMLVPDIVP
jgi:hypothetical protein